jgi:phage terminase small subunit
MPRQRKPLSELKLTGAYRADRHGGRTDAPKMEGLPVKPAGLDRDASALWDQTVPQLIEKGIVFQIDTAALTAMCELWSLYRKSLRSAKKKPLDKIIRSAVLGYWQAFNVAAGRCGLTPGERAKLPSTDGRQGNSAKSRFFDDGLSRWKPQLSRKPPA